MRRKELKERIRKNLHKIKKKAQRLSTWLSTFTGAGRGCRSDLSWAEERRRGRAFRHQGICAVIRNLRTNERRVEPTSPEISLDVIKMEVLMHG